MFYDKYSFDQIIKENFDLSDRATRKYLVSLDEDDRSAVTTALASALYDKIVANVDKIDFGSIPKSMGDITKVDGFDKTIECIDIIKKLVTEYKESTETVDTVSNAIENVKSRKALFMKAFATKSNLPINFYNLIVLAIEHSVSFLISVCIEYIKNNDTKTIDMAIDKAAYNNAQDNLLFEQLKGFNEACGSGELDSTFTEILKVKPVKEDSEIHVGGETEPVYSDPVYTPSDDSDGSELFSGDYDENEPVNIEPIIPENDDVDVETDDEELDYEFDEDDVKPAFDIQVSTNESVIAITGILGALLNGILIGGAVAGGAALVLKVSTYIIKVLVPKMRNLSYFFIHTRVKISDSLAVQAQLLELNAYKVKYDDDIDAEKRDKIAQKQLKIADSLKKWSNKIAIDNKTSEKKATDDIKKVEKVDLRDIKDDIPDGDIF